MKKKVDLPIRKEDIPFRGMIPIMVLCIMADNEKHHDQGLVNEINKIAGMEDFAKRTSVKDAVKRLLDYGDAHLHSEVEGPYTVYYQITEKGKETAERRIQQARDVRSIMYQFFKLYDNNISGLR